MAGPEGPQPREPLTATSTCSRTQQCNARFPARSSWGSMLRDSCGTRSTALCSLSSTRRWVGATRPAVQANGLTRYAPAGSGRAWGRGAVAPKAAAGRDSETAEEGDSLAASSLLTCRCPAVLAVPRLPGPCVALLRRDGHDSVGQLTQVGLSGPIVDLSSRPYLRRANRVS